MSNPSCLQIGASCRYADASGQIHDAVIIAVVSAPTGAVSLQYDDGRQRVENVLHSSQPAREHWGCADEGVPHPWSELKQV
jgi:hypothetical protein